MVTCGYPKHENDDGSLENKGYPFTDSEICVKHEAFDIVTPSNSGLCSLLRRSLVKFAKTEYKGIVEDVSEFVNEFNERTPEYCNQLGNKAVMFNAEKLKRNGWRL